ncbi:hypothetical protein GYMLUDRAFT_54910 [Collybiopsis luxurians FD-317 M1]|nr:hypothetical protein GYMLUDRAFT_54910 [Collybiopsis luxurians FD-317 M1]
MIPSLPRDVLCLVIDEFKDCRVSLTTFSLVNHSVWLDYSRHLLFHSVTVLDHRVDEFLRLCRSPYSTLGRSIQNLRLLQRRISRNDEVDTSMDCSSPLDPHSLTINKVFTRKSDSTGYPIMVDCLLNLRQLAFGGFEWWNISESAKNSIHSGFRGVTTLELAHADFRNGNELSRLLSSFTALERLVLDRVIQRNPSALDPEPILASTDLASPPSVHTIQLKNMLPSSTGIINSLIPFAPTLTSLTIHLLPSRALASLDSYLAVAHLITAAGKSLQELSVFLPAGQHSSGSGKLDIVYTF